MLVSWTGWIQENKNVFSPSDHQLRPRRCLSRSFLRFESERWCPWKMSASGRSFQRRFDSWLVQCSRSAFFLPSPDVSCLLNDTALYLLIWTVWSKSFINVSLSEIYPAADVSQALNDRFHCSLNLLYIFLANCLSYGASLIPVCFFGLPLSPETDRGRMTARDQPRLTSASSPAPLHRDHSLAEPHLGIWLAGRAGSLSLFLQHLKAMHQ